MKSKRKCRDIETGIVYDSATELSEAIGISLHKVYHILNGRVNDSVGIEYVGESLVGTFLKEAKCTKCNIIKPREDFGIDKRYNNPRSYCKLCACIKEQEYRKANPEKIRASNIKQAYKVSTERAYELMAIWNCESCGVELEKSEANVRTKNAQVVDHCHTTGEVRGVLCSGCNLALGHLSDSIEKITALKEYLIKTNNSND